MMKMRTEEKSAVKNSVGRLVFVVLCVLLQAAWIVTLFIRLNEYSTVITVIMGLLSLIVAMRLYGTEMNAAMKLPWIMLLIAFPILGLCLYLLLGNPGATRGMKKHFEGIDRELSGFLIQEETVWEALAAADRGVYNESRYIRDYGPYPLYGNTDTEFYGDASQGFEAQLCELEKAEHFIFMEYHAIEESTAFYRLRDVLQKKVREGVEVRLLYDDIGSVGFINTDFIKRMEKLGIQCRVFNRLIPILNVFMNNRDHRKITVIDGKTGFTGGYNLADEYFNLTHPYGRWKDTGVKLTGDAVRTLTVLFLSMWNSIKHTDEDYGKYLQKTSYKAREPGFVQPYADSPLDHECVGENVYLNLIKDAKEEIYFTTPYLIISDEMARELTLAAKRGVDVRIITPGIPDKKFIFRVTRSYYPVLAKSGVRIYEYTPGFIHAKQCVCDRKTAAVGTINLDFRSLYLHFENGVLLYGCPAVEAIHKDFLETFPLCGEVTDRYRAGRSTALRVWQCVLRLISPLL